MSGQCDWCDTWHSGSCYHPGRTKYNAVVAERDALQVQVQRVETILISSALSWDTISFLGSFGQSLECEVTVLGPGQGKEYLFQAPVTNGSAILDLLERAAKAVWDNHGKQLTRSQREPGYYDERREQIAALTARVAELEGEWQPIETAPKDGTEILLFAMGDMGICYWRNDDELKGWTWGMGKRFLNPTLWRPLPAAPKGTQTQKENQ